MEQIDAPPLMLRRTYSRALRGTFWLFVASAVAISAWLWCPIITLAARQYGLLPKNVDSNLWMNHYWHFFARYPQFFRHYVRCARTFGVLDERSYWNLRFGVMLAESELIEEPPETGFGCRLYVNDHKEWEPYRFQWGKKPEAEQVFPRNWDEISRERKTRDGEDGVSEPNDEN